MLLRMGIAAIVTIAAVASQPNAAQAAGRLAAFRAARAAAAESAAALPAPAAAALARPVSLQAAEPVQPPPSAVMAPAGPVAGCTTCCPQPCLIYRHRGHHRACCGCAPPVETVLAAINPCTCCPVEIPVCVPACCTCAPTMSCHSGLLCSGVVEFDWSCGFSVTVRFKHNGDVVVVTRG